MITNMRNRATRVRTALLALCLSATAWTPSSGPRASASSSIHLHGTVLDQEGHAIAAYIEVMDSGWQPLGSAFTTPDGSYDLTVPDAQGLAVTATPLSTAEQTVEIDGGYLLSQYFELTRATEFITPDLDIGFVLPPASHLWLWAYTPAGGRLLMGDLYSQLNPPFYGMAEIYGALPMASAELPLPTEASIGKLRPAGRPDTEWGQSEPCFAVPPGEAVYLMMPWPVPDMGFVPVRADNRGAGYRLAPDQVTRINLVYEFAETGYRGALELKAGYEAWGYTFSSTVADKLAEAACALAAARGETDWRAQAQVSYPALAAALRAKEQMTLEVADEGIEGRKLEWAVTVQDEAGRPLPGVSASYRQTASEFILSYGNHLPSYPFPYAGFKAGQEMGFEYLYDGATCVWKLVSPAPGVYDFDAIDAALDRAQLEGWRVVATLSWLGDQGVPDWALNLPFPEFKQRLAEFVRAAVEHYRGHVEYLAVIHEPGTKTRYGSRYLDLRYRSDYGQQVQPEELIELMRVALEAAREVNSDILFGYAADPDYAPWQLVPLTWGGRLPAYSFMQRALEEGVKPDWVGPEFQCCMAHVPLDLSTLGGILQAYHDVSGVPVMVVEMSGCPSRTEDYGLTGPAPGVFWHEGMTQQVQAEWATSIARIELGLPYVLGFQMAHNQPDYFAGSPREGTGDGTDYITNEFQRKKVYYASKELFESWRGAGSGVTDDEGRLRLTGLAGTWGITLTTASGLVQTYELPLDAQTGPVTLTLDTSRDVADLQDRLTAAQQALDWSLGLGRELGYPALREELAQARSALAAGEYGSARSLAQSVLDATAITIDGDPSDWAGIPPIATAEPGGVQVDAPGIDLKALYGVMDEEYLYLMVEVHDPPITMQPETVFGWLRFPQFLFDLDTGNGKRHHVRTYLPYGGQMDVYRLSEPASLLSTQYTLAYGQVLEFKVPLALLDDPSSISVCAFVMAAENGAEKVAKAFERCAHALQPTHLAFVPLAAVR